MEMQSVYVFNGSGATLPAAVFSDRARAIAWIERHGLSGTLTEYPLDISAYDWAVDKGYFKPKRDEQSSPRFVERFSSATQWHQHFENGGVGGPDGNPPA